MKIKYSDLLIKTLEDMGIEKCFCVTGGTLAHILNSIIDSKIENNWISGHGPMDFEVCLVSWCDGTVKWVDTASLTSYGL